ncbi:DMT family transporter [Massilia sp. TS11]|uniref:DMT family transporter n=1 Tax=Massilia sp. TS11 TaxID=2908003 RepID=UPI001EDBA2A9|nr:DMT family transporter [Massilia sp. TS11]MCG2583084.1 DMT family transporter [Massilia sp. TS11]
MWNGSTRLSLAMAIAGTIGIFVLASGQPAPTVVFYRCLFGAAALWTWLLWDGNWQPMKEGALLWLVLGALSLVGNWVCLFLAFKYSSISVATIVYHTQPFILLLLVAVQTRALPDKRKLAWLGLAFAGVVMVSLRDGEGASAQGVLLALAAALLYALSTQATRKLSAYAPAQIAGMQMLIGALALSPFSHLVVVADPFTSWTSLMLLGLVHTGLMYHLMYSSYQSLRPEAIATLAFIYPAVAVLVDRLVLGTQLAGLQLAGLGLIVLAVVANQRLR